MDFNTVILAFAALGAFVFARGMVRRLAGKKKTQQ